MIDIEVMDIIEKLQSTKAETNAIEAKAAINGCPKKIYDTLSAFSNTSGGVIIFGIDETNDYEVCGVYDAGDLQKKVVEQCNQMIPAVRANFSTINLNDKSIVVAEIPEVAFTNRPVYYSGAGIQKGSYIRVGDADIRMTDIEIYSLMTYKNKIYDELKVVVRAELEDLDYDKLDEFIKKQAKKKPNFSKLGKERMLKDLGIIDIVENGKYKPTIAGLMCFGIYPQSIFPQWMVTCVALPGYQMGEVGGIGERFIDNKKIEGTIPEMIEGVIDFVIKNMSVKTIINSKNGKREDKSEYPINAIREGILNALIHRDYSFHTEGIYIQIRMYKNRIEIQSPGGLYGKISVDLLGTKRVYDARNPNIIRVLEELEVVENRGSGIPTMIDEMESYGLEEPSFESSKGDFIVSFYGSEQDTQQDTQQDTLQDTQQDTLQDEILTKIINFCEEPRSRKEIADYVRMKDIRYLRDAYLKKLLDGKRIKMTLPEKPTSRNQKYIAIEKDKRK